MSSIPTTCTPPAPSLVSPNDWVWTVVKYERVEDLEDLMLKCYETLVAERPTIKTLLHFSMGSHVVERSQRKLPEYRRAGLLLAIFTFTSLSQNLTTNILGRFYRHRDAWRFRSFLALASKAAAGEEPFAISRDLVWLVVDLLTKYLSNWDSTGKHVPLLPPLPLHSSSSSRPLPATSPSSSSAPVPKVVVIEDDQPSRTSPLKRKLGKVK